MLTVTPYLWFDNQAEEAMTFYATIFPRTKQLSVTRMGEQVMMAEFEIEGQKFMALNGGPMYKFTEAVSFFVSCKTQQEIDTLWEKLSADGGEPGRCGWLKDKFGLSWQIVPATLGSLMSSGDPAKSQRVGAALMSMNKLEIAGLQKAFDGA
jgi:predicted 3-demethylubiquinone-9 3-methyltransferase (glyoxalase superfamily)